MFLYTLFIAGLLGASADLLFPNVGTKEPDWNGLKVTWGPEQTGKYFDSMPRKVDDAEGQGFVKISDCDASKNASFRGQRYLKDNDDALILLYDIKGFIAGIQMAIPSGLPNNVPSKQIAPPVIKVEDKYYLTAYFVPPDTICTKGRTPLEFHTEGTGSSLLIQNGTNPDTDLWEIPLNEKDLKSTKWVPGTCFPTMGMHYWYDMSLEKSCDTIMPLFILYNNNRLTAFGWAVQAYLNSTRFEHAPQKNFKIFFVTPPRCLYRPGFHLSTMHIFLTNDIAAIKCPVQGSGDKQNYN